jgi:methylenetetrahydrofolate dehydrogenase (NADP+) / methenyltetrahydrofolate cyclohydrolase
MARIIDGKSISAKVRAEVTEKAARFKQAYGRAPGLDVVLVGEDPASQVYVRNIPSQIRQTHVIRAIDPQKDVDGLNPLNAGALASGDVALAPCTPLGCIRLLREIGANLAGAEAVVVGRSNLVGKPVAQLLLLENATVTVAHSKTRDLPGVCRRADVLVAAIGRAKMLNAAHVKPGAIVIDVGMNRDEHGKLCGDVDFAAVEAIASAITPVPGGVGPMTIAMLLENTVTAGIARLSAR